ncbi:lymphocyte cytosolic protein 2 [Chanos chanos]|uniref:Lymphocyte cytosolic protein 2 n=1 Tax=Chanos chanos TaxID=29144 RepID=A0A6J2UN74_CHACN|nr:lymphocyte cytosolic protein 2-like [Chanos chanos]
MSFDNFPSKSEVMGWNPNSLADYLKKMKLSGCDTVVKKCGMNGSWFLNMSENDLHKFPKVHAPIIMKICNKINQSQEKKGIFHRYAGQNKQWDSDEFDQDESDNDYEEPDEFPDDNYVCATVDRPDRDEESDDDYEPPPSDTPDEIPSHFQLAKPLGGGDYIATAGPGVPKVDRSKKPGSSGLSKTDSGRSAKPPLPKAHLDRHSSEDEEDMDPSWYVGQMTRRDAEASLRYVNKDGAFLVRDSSKGSTEQPYTLMVLYQDKVYNIQVRYQGVQDGYSLGTGLMSNESFPSVRDIITHHTKAKLLLIDAMDRGSGPQRQCCLMYPVSL